MLQNIYDLERSFESQIGRSALQQLLNEAGYQYRTLYKDLESFVTHTEIMNDKRVSSFGSGKGLNHQIGALAEAFEHHLIENEDLDQAKHLSLSTICSQPQLEREHRLRNLMKSGSQETIPCSPFQNLLGESVQIPLAYINPVSSTRWADNQLHQNLMKYSTNSGVSFGFNLTDSLLHGLNEAIERHYTSLFYLTLLGLHHSTQWYCIKNYIPHWHKDLQVKIKSLEQTCSLKILTITCQTIFGTWYSISIGLTKGKSQFLIPPQGMGSSLYPQLAHTRSMDELVQICKLYSQEEKNEDKQALQLLKSYPGLSPVFYNTEKQIWRMNSKTKVPKALKKNLDQPLSPQDQLQIIQSQLEKQGYQLLYRTLFNKSNSAFVTQVFIPGFERFHLIRSGLTVSPQQLNSVRIL